MEQAVTQPSLVCSSKTSYNLRHRAKYTPTANKGNSRLTTDRKFNYSEKYYSVVTAHMLGSTPKQT